MSGKDVGVTDRFTFYFGAASGSSRKALRMLEEPNVMLNYATQSNTPWDGIERLFIDSGGYSFMLGKGEYTTSNAHYLDFVEEHDPEIFALRDYACEPDVLEENGRTVRDHQRMTTEKHIELMDLIESRGIDAQPLSVLQGWTVDDYLRHVDDLREHGLLTDRIGVGSICRRNQDHEIRRVLKAIDRELPNRCSIHAFGVKANVLRFADVREILRSADSMAYEYRAHWVDDEQLPSKSWRDSAFGYLKQRRTIRSLLASDVDDGQTTLGEVGA